MTRPVKMEKDIEHITKLDDLPQMDKTKLPSSPSPAPEVSPSDEWEKVNHAAGVISDEFESLKGKPQGLPKIGKGKTCQAACLSCMEMNSNVPNCACHATCSVGGAGPDTCERRDLSWSNNAQAIPNESWLGKCQEGTVSCSDCLGEELLAENERCSTATSPAICRLRLRLRVSQPVKYQHYCWSSEIALSDCETFMYAPKESGWSCYTTLQQCQYARVPYEDRLDG